jgi:TonB family protein
MTMKATLALIAVLLLNLPALGADPEPYLKSAPMPFYPPLARAARIEGKVSLHFTVDERGDTSEVEATTGHELLKRAATANLQNWKFGWPHPCVCRVKREAVLVYVLSGVLPPAETPTVTVKWFLKAPVTRVEIEAAPELTPAQP